MSETRDQQAKIEAAKERLKKFCRPASQCRNRHDPERFERWREGRQNEPRACRWDELGRASCSLW